MTKSLTPSSINYVAQTLCLGFNSLPATTNYFDLYTAHNISHLFTEAIVSDNYSSQQDKHRVGQCTRATICCINNMPCQLSRLDYGWMNTAKMEPVSDASLCSIRVVTLSLLTVRNLSDLIQKNGLWMCRKVIKIFTVASFPLAVLACRCSETKFRSF